MAVIKAVSSKAGIGHAIDYVTKKEKTEEKLVSGLHCEPETVKEEMQATKELWGKTDGRTYKHYVQSYHEDEEITPEQAHKNAVELAEHTKAWKGHEVLIATHIDKALQANIEAIQRAKQTRIHRDIDINFDAQHTEKLLNVLLNLGYKIDTDWKPVRIELYSDELGYLDIHPFVLNEDGTSKQADLEGGWYEFEKDYFGSVFFEGKTIPCISLKGQKVFHSGYELRDKDKHDISILESLSK